MLYQTSRALDDHLRDTFVALRELVKRRVDDFHVRSYNGFLNVCNLLGRSSIRRMIICHIRMSWS